MNFTFENIANCKICNSPKFHNLFEKKDDFTGLNFNIVECELCKLTYVNPRVSEKHMTELYSNSYFHGDNWDSDTDYFSNYSKEERLKKIGQMYLEHYEIIKKFTGNPNPKILDVGAGLGFFAQSVAEKYPSHNITCLDFSEYAVTHMKSKGLDAHQGTIELFNTDKKFDGVYMREVIEHLYNPLDALKKINKLLNNNGIFYYTTGNTDQVKDLKQWSYVRPVGHINYFNYASISKLMELTGFKPLPIEICKLEFKKTIKGYLRFFISRLGLSPKELPLGRKVRDHSQTE